MSTLYVDNLQPNLGSRVLVPGHVVQTVSQYQGTGVVSFTASGTILSLSITPTLTTSKILVIASGSSERYTGSTTNYYNGNMARSIGGGADAFIGYWSEGAHYANANNERNQATISIFDAPNTTSEITYKITADVYGGGYYAKQCSLILMEIAQ